METFMASYAEELAKAVAAHPDEYRFGPEEVPRSSP